MLFFPDGHQIRRETTRPQRLEAFAPARKHVFHTKVF